MKQKELFKEFLRYVTLNVCGMLGLSCYILADTFFVSGGLGANGLTALNLAIPVYSFVNGCGDSDSIRKILVYAITTMLLLSGCIYIVFLWGADPIIKLFNRDQNSLLQQIAATEKALQAQAVSLSRGFFIIVPMTFFLSYAFDMTGVWLSYPVTELLVSVIGLILLNNCGK